MGIPQRSTVLIHGYGFDSRIWSPVELAFEGHRIIYLALPGFDGSAVSEKYTISSLAKNYWHQLDMVGIETVNLVGHSMGGYACMEMLASAPSRVKSLALIHSHVFEDSDEKKSARTKTMLEITNLGRAGFTNKLIYSLFADPLTSAALIRQLVFRGLLYDDNAWYFGTGAMRDRKDHRETLASIHVPVLMLMGENDNAIPSPLIYLQALLSERTSIQVYPGVGHMGMYENTRQMISDLIRFYDSFSL